MLNRLLIVLGCVLLFGAGALAWAAELRPEQGELPPIVFVARAHLATPDDIFSDELGPAGQFGTGLTKFAPGSRLVRRNPDGSLYLYNTPGLIDLQAPDVSFDGNTIIFAGAAILDEADPDYGWRLYEINVDGSNFHQLTFSDRNIEIPNADQFGNLEIYRTYNDLFPAYLADGRIVFNSSRYPTRSHYDERRTYNLYVMNGDGSNLHRISTERGGLLHPTPLPDGRIMVSRWWNQFNQPSEQAIYNRIDNSNVDHFLPDGTLILANPDSPFNAPLARLLDGYPVRDAPNTWHIMALNPDGTDFQRLAWTPRYEYALTDDSGFFDTYAAAQPALVFQGQEWFVAYTSQVDSTMVHSTLLSGIRVARPGLAHSFTNTTDAIAGLSYDQAWGQNNDDGPYALHPAGMPDGRILYSQSHEDPTLPPAGTFSQNGQEYPLQGSNLQYTLYLMNIDGNNKTALGVDLGSIGLATADAMDAVAIVPRLGWQSLPDTFTDVANDDPRLGNVPNSLPAYWFSLHGPADIQTATVHNPNVYANASLDYPYINNSPPPGSVATAQIWIDANQFTGAYCYNDYPQPCDNFQADNELRAVLWTEVPVTLQGAFTATVPADTMGFVVLRDSEGRVVREWSRGYISIAQGSAWARPGETVTCVGCHLGHVSGSLDQVIDEAKLGWTNLAPYAAVAASSYWYVEDPSYHPFTPEHINDRRGWVLNPAGDSYQDQTTGWITAEGQAIGEWIDLSWPSAVLVSKIRLVGPPPTVGDWDGFGQPPEYGDYYVESGTLRLLYNGNQATPPIAVGRIEPWVNGGTLITLDPPVVIDRLRFTVDGITGRWWWNEIAALNEIEVIGMATEPYPLLELWRIFVPSIIK